MSDKKSCHDLTAICQTNPALQGWLEKTLYLTQLSSVVKTQLTAPLCDHVSVANYRDTCLVLALDNPVWVTELRYKREALVSTLRATILPSLATIEWLIIAKP